MLRRCQRTLCEPLRSTVPGSKSSTTGTSAADRWWPTEPRWSGRFRRDMYDNTRKTFDGTLLPEVKVVPGPDEITDPTFIGDTHFFPSNPYLMGEKTEQDNYLPPPPPFDPNKDELEESDWHGSHLMGDVVRAAEEDKRRLTELGNPLTAADALDMFMRPSREGLEVRRQREDFNGFAHWGLLHAANIALRNNDHKMAHQLVNRYLRDVDLFEKWLDHDKVRKHMMKKFNIDTKGRLDKLMAMCMALYIRSKVQVFESDIPGALRSLVGSVTLIRDSGDLTNPRHRKALGVVLAARGFCHQRLESPQRAEEDFTQCLAFLPAKRCATVYQLRAEVYEKLGKLEEARRDEERAADILENAEIIYPGMDMPPQKWVL